MNWFRVKVRDRRSGIETWLSCARAETDRLKLGADLAQEYNEIGMDVLSVLPAECVEGQKFYRRRNDPPGTRIRFAEPENAVEAYGMKVITPNEPETELCVPFTCAGCGEHLEPSPDTEFIAYAPELGKVCQFCACMYAALDKDYWKHLHNAWLAGAEERYHYEEND